MSVSLLIVTRLVIDTGRVISRRKATARDLDLIFRQGLRGCSDVGFLYKFDWPTLGIAFSPTIDQLLYSITPIDVRVL